MLRTLGVLTMYVVSQLSKNSICQRQFIHKKQGKNPLSWAD